MLRMDEGPVVPGRAFDDLAPRVPRRRLDHRRREEPEAFRQYYFDSRGVRRIYEMTLDDGVWTLWRDSPDPFPQRFTGTFEDDGQTMSGRWEKAPDGTNWEIDFDLIYRKRS
jgi:hypothetical protein